MTDRGLRVFVSSSIGELLVERDHVRRALADLDLVSFTYENDAPATMGSHQGVWREALVDSGICLAIIHRKAGIYTQDEINTARAEGIPLLVYRRLLEPGETLPPDEQAFVDELDHPVSGIALRLYEDPESLAKRVRYDIPDLLAEWAKRIRKILKAERAEATGVRHTAESTEAGLVSEQAKGPGIRPLDPEDARRLGPNEGAFVGRASQLAKLRSFLTMPDRRIALVGEGGSGRKAVLRAFTHSGEAEGGFEHGAGIHPFQSPGDDLEDLRQAIWEEFFVAEDDDPSVVNPRRRRRDLRNRNALIVLLDLALDDAQIAELVEDMPKAKFVITRAADAGWGGKRIDVPPLESEAEIIELFETRYNGTVPAAARASVLTMAAHVGAIPARIEMLANRAWDDATDPGDDGPDHPLIAWSAAKASLDPQELLRWLIPDAETEIAGVMAVVDAHTPREVLAEVVPLRRVDLALADGTAISASPRYALNPALLDAVDVADPEQRLAEVFAATMRWVATADHDRIYQERAFVLRMLDHATRVGDYSGVIALARATEHAFAMGGRHGAWRQTLEKAHAAGEAAGDAEATSWALHQLGTRALLRDELDDAREFLHDALEIREERGDDEAAELTRRNLKLVPMALTSVATIVLTLLLLVGWGAALNDDGAAWGGFGIGLEVSSSEPEPETNDVALVVDVSGDEPFIVTAIQVTDLGETDGDPIIPDPECIGAAAATESTCAFDIAVEPFDGSTELAVEVTVEAVDTGDPHTETAIVTVTESEDSDENDETTDGGGGDDPDDGSDDDPPADDPDLGFAIGTILATPDTIGPGPAEVTLTVPLTADEDFTIDQLEVTMDGEPLPFRNQPACLDDDAASPTTCVVVVEVIADPGVANLAVEISATGGDGSEGADDDSVSITVEIPDFVFRVSDLDAPSSVDEGAVFALTVSVDGGDDPFTVTEATVTVDGQPGDIRGIDCLGPEIVGSAPCSILVAAPLSPPDASVAVTMTASRSADGEPGSDRVEEIIGVNAVVDPIAAALDLTSSAGRVSGDDLTFNLEIRNPGGEVATGILVTDGRGQAAQCGSTVLAAGATQICTLTIRPDATELADREVRRTITFGSAEQRTLRQEPVSARFSTVAATVTTEGTTSGISGATVTLGGRSRTVGASSPTILLAEPGSESVQFTVPPTSTLTAVACDGSSAAPATPAGATFEQTVAIGADAAVNCSFTLLGHPVIDVFDETVILTSAALDGTITIQNVGTLDATNFALDVPAGFVLTTPCPSTLAAGASCTAAVRYDGVDPTVNSEGPVELRYDGVLRGDSRVRLIYQAP